MKLVWEPGATDETALEVLQFELQEAMQPDFSDARLVYSGSDRASFISGLANGDYYYRVRNLDGDVPGAWSDPLTITVEHHPLSLALLLFGLGFVVVAATFAVVIRGSLKPEGGASE